MDPSQATWASPYAIPENRVNMQLEHSNENNKKSSSIDIVVVVVLVAQLQSITESIHLQKKPEKKEKILCVVNWLPIWGRNEAKNDEVSSPSLFQVASLNEWKWASWWWLCIVTSSSVSSVCVWLSLPLKSMDDFWSSHEMKPSGLRDSN